MARTITFPQYVEAMYECYQALAAETWAAQYEQEPMYPDGVRPTSVCYPEAEILVNTFMAESSIDPDPVE